MSGRKRRHREEPCSICDHYHDVSGKASVSALAPWSAEPEKRAGDAREKKGRRAGSSQSMALTVSRCHGPRALFVNLSLPTSFFLLLPSKHQNPSK